MAKGPQVGEQAPDFELPGTQGAFRLSDHRGERVVLLFYPGDNTPVCTKQFCSYRDRSEDMTGLDAVVVGISHQDVASHEAFTAKFGLTTALLADVDKAVAKLYGVSAPVLGTRRAAIVIDEGGVVRVRHVHALVVDFQDADELRSALAALDPRTGAAA
jgi:peroxiredoxin Q/BCP